MIVAKDGGEIFSSRVRWMPFFVGPAFCILVGLGVWQLDRLSWKNTLIGDIQTRLASPPITLGTCLGGVAIELCNYRRITVAGKLMHEKSVALLARTYKKRAGANVLTPLSLGKQGAILINLGWVPQNYELRKLAKDFPVTIEGIVRTTTESRGWFVPENNPVSGQWHWIDLSALSEEMGLVLLPIIIESKQGEDPAVVPIGGQTRVNLPNDHLQYAVTWFGLAVVLLVSFLVYYWKYLTAKKGKVL